MTTLHPRGMCRRYASDIPIHLMASLFAAMGDLPDAAPNWNVAPTGVAGLTQAMRLNPRPLGVRQNISIHPQRESHPPPPVNPHSS